MKNYVFNKVTLEEVLRRTPKELYCSVRSSRRNERPCGRTGPNRTQTGREGTLAGTGVTPNRVTTLYCNLVFLTRSVNE